MPSNSNWVCFDCRAVVRRSKFSGQSVVPCPECGRACVCLWHKIALPPKTARRAWEALRSQQRDRRHRVADAMRLKRVRRQHELERQIAELSTRGESRAQAATLRQLREELAQIDQT